MFSFPSGAVALQFQGPGYQGDAMWYYWPTPNSQAQSGDVAHSAPLTSVSDATHADPTGMSLHQAHHGDWHFFHG
jgi:hypothetical protein